MPRRTFGVEAARGLPRTVTRTHLRARSLFAAVSVFLVANLARSRGHCQAGGAPIDSELNRVQMAGVIASQLLEQIDCQMR